MNGLPPDGWMVGVAFVIAVMDWIAVGLHRRGWEYFFKPAVLIAVIILALLITQGPHDEWQAQFFLIGLVFSLAGDVFLMLPGDGFFLPGLISFLLAHLCYFAGLNPALPPLQSLLFIVPVAIVGFALYRRIASSLSEIGETGLLIPVAIYSFAISVMLFSAWATLWRGDWTTSRRVLVITGASLFFASDAMLAWNKFVKPFRAAEIGVIVTYHLGQLALASSIAAGLVVRINETMANLTFSGTSMAGWELLVQHCPALPDPNVEGRVRPKGLWSSEMGSGPEACRPVVDRRHRARRKLSTIGSGRPLQDMESSRTLRLATQSGYWYRDLFSSDEVASEDKRATAKQSGESPSSSADKRECSLD